MGTLGLLITVLVHWCCECSGQQQGRSFLWYGDRDGLTSHLLQLKIYHYLAQTFNRSLVVATVSSAHFANQGLEVCQIVDLAQSGLPGASCVSSKQPKASCLGRLTPALMGSPLSQLCYKGPLPNIYGATSRKQSVLRAMNLTSQPLRLQPKYMTLFEAAKKALRLNEGEEYTAVHWRRGDQLKTRCAKQWDLSVNCGNASALISAVQRRTKHKRIFVATNEPSDSKEYKALMDKGYTLFSSIQNDEALKGQSLSNLDVFVIELAIMIDATTFLGFGLTEIKDLVERERMLRKKSFCVVRETSADGAVAASADTGTWCGVHHGGFSGFKTDWVESVWVPPGETSSQNTAGGLLKNGNGGKISMSKKAALLLAQSSSQQGQGQGQGDAAERAEAHLDKARVAQADLFQPLPKKKQDLAAGNAAKTSAGTAGAAASNGAAGAGAGGDVGWNGGGSTSKRKHTQSSAGAPTAAPKRADNSTLQNYQALLRTVREGGGRLPKRAFSDQLRMVVVVGLEGTGHHAMKSIFSECMDSADAATVESSKAKCAVDDRLNSLLMHTYVGKPKLGLFFAEDAARGGELSTAVQASLRNISLHAENVLAGNHRLYITGLEFTPGGGMLSYPNFGGPSKTLNHPDAFLLAALAENAGLDLRVLVLSRNTADVLRSVSSRNFGGEQEARILANNAESIYTQLSLLDRRFLMCVDYEELSSISSNRTRKDELAKFLHPVVVPRYVDKMLSRFVPSNKSSNRPPLSRPNLTSNAALAELQLEARVLKIRELCPGNL